MSVKGGESEWFRVDSGMRQGCVMSPCLFNVYMDGVMIEVKMGMKKRGVRFMEEGREWSLPDLLFAGNFVLCGESEEDLRVMVLWFAEVFKRRGGIRV